MALSTGSEFPELAAEARLALAETLRLMGSAEARPAAAEAELYERKGKHRRHSEGAGLPRHRSRMRIDLPSGTVTFLFTDVEGSTRLLRSLGAALYAEALAEHRRAIREACSSEGGVEVDTQGDAPFFFAFRTAPGALSAAAAFTAALCPRPDQRQEGIHTGTPFSPRRDTGEDVHRAARIGATGHGGQVLVSASTVAPRARTICEISATTG